MNWNSKPFLLETLSESNIFLLKQVESAIDVITSFALINIVHLSKTLIKNFYYFLTSFK